MLISFVRIIKFSVQDLCRNIWLSLVTVIILVLALFTVNMLLVVKVVGQTAIDAIKDKIDINLSLRATADESSILELKAQIEAMPEVREATYISKAEALTSFQEKNKDNPEVLEALRVLGKNPLSPSLVIKAKNLDDFDNLTGKLNSLENNIIESRNFTNYKSMLEKIDSITNKVSDAGLALSAIFILITVLVVFNSIRVTIYTHRKEIGIMRLVGASHWFIQMPYMISGLIYTIIGIGTIMLIFYPFLSLLQPYLEAFFVGYSINIFRYFYSNMALIFGVQFLIAGTINMIASLLAVRKYSKI